MRSKKLEHIKAILMVLLFMASSNFALAQVSASISGQIEDASGAAIPTATVTAKNLETGATRTVTTDEGGNYRILALPVGRYEVAAEKTGFNKEVRTGIRLMVGQEAVVSLSMAVGEVRQEVTVTAEAPIVNTTTASTAGLVGEREVKDLPLNGRSFDNLITLNPGVNNATTAMKGGLGSTSFGSLFNILGGRSQDNLFLLNGVEYTGANQVGATPGGVSGELLGIDAVREFNVQTSTYGAEYGKRPGQISIVTMSGGNQFHGTVFEFLRNSALDAANFFTNKGRQQKPAFRRNDFGAAAGGPIRKDRTFIFGNYEGFRQSLTTTNLAFVPDANARKGFLPIGPGGALVDVGVAPGMAQYFQIYPEPNGRVLGGGIAESFTPAVNPVREDFGTVRVDQIFSDKDWLSGSYTVDDGINTLPQANPLSGTALFLRAQVLTLEEIHTFSPSVINTARIGYSRAASFGNSAPLISLPASMSLIAGKPLGIIGVGGNVSTGSGGALSIFGGVSQGRRYLKNLFTYSDSMQIVKGKHLISLGAWFERLQLNGMNGTSSSYGQATFLDLASFLQGKAAILTAGLAPTMVYWRQWEGAWYAQDNIKVLPTLTVNLGLRHEFNNGWNVTRPMPVNFLYDANGVMLTQPLIGKSAFTTNNAKWLLAPRVGLAWDLFGNGKTSVHAGFGTYYNIYDDLVFATPQPASSIANNVQFPIQITPGSGGLAGGAPAVFNIPADAKTPTVQEWSFTVEQEVTPTTVLSVGYVGSHGTHFLGLLNSNPTHSVICSTSLSNCPAGLANGTKYFPSAAQSARLNPNLNGTFSVWPISNSSYNSLLVDVRQRLTKGLTFRANYTYAKSLDEKSEVTAGFQPNCPAVITDFTKPTQDYGPSCFDVTHRFALSASYDLPIGHGKALLGALSGPADKLLGGWKLNGILTAQNGMPFTPLVGFNNSRTGDILNADRPSVNPNFSGPVILGDPNKWFNPNAFILPPAGTFGNLGKNPLRGPGLSELDLSLFKDTHLGERLNLQFRAEFFNILNHANFATPATLLFTSSGGQVGSAAVVSSTITTSRQIQFGLKVIW